MISITMPIIGRAITIQWEMKQSNFPKNKAKDLKR